MMQGIKTFLIFCVIGVIAQTGDSMGVASPYDIGMHNLTSQNLENVQITMGKYKTLNQGLLPNQKSSEAHHSIKPTETALVQWQTQDGVMHKETVPVKDLIPKNFSGQILFRFESDGTVKVIPKSDKEIKRLADELRRNAEKRKK